MFKIIKKGANNFWHWYNNDSKKVSISSFDMVLDDVSNTVQIVLRNGSNIPSTKLLVADIEVIDQTDASIVEVFSNVQALRNRLVSLGYTAYLSVNGIQSIQAGTNISIDNTDPSNPIVSATGGGGGSQDIDNVLGVGDTAIDKQLILDTADVNGTKNTIYNNVISIQNKDTTDYTNITESGMSTSTGDGNYLAQINPANISVGDPIGSSTVSLEKNRILHTKNTESGSTSIDFSNPTTDKVFTIPNETGIAATRTWVGVQGFITNVITALGFTPENSVNKSTSTADSGSSIKFPVWSAIVSYFSASQIRSILGITTLSGSNTGDQDLSGLGDMFKSTYDTDNTGVVDNAEAIKVIGRNSTGSTLRKGTIIYISGSTGNRPNFVKAKADVETTSAGTFGVIANDIANNTDGYALCLGYLDNLDTRSTATYPFTSDTLADGDTVYLSPSTAGYITNVKPSAPNHLVYIGKVTKTSPTSGTIVYRIQNGYELEELHNVAISSVADKQLLSYDNATSLWKNKSVTTADIADSTGKRYQTDNQQSFNDATSSIQTQLNGKVTNARTINTKALTADIVLNTDDIAESGTPTNKYFTNARSLATVLTGISASSGTFIATDSILTAFGKIKYLIDNISTLYQVALTDANFGTFISGLTAKTTPIDADSMSISDSADSNKQKKVSLTNFKAFLKTFFDSLYLNKSRYVFSGYTTITGVTSQTVLLSLKIPAGAYDANDAFEILGAAVKGTTAANINYNIYHDTVVNGTTNAIATAISVNTNARVSFQRFITLFSGNAYNSLSSNANIFVPSLSSTNTPTITTFNPAVDNWITLTVNPSVTSEVVGVYFFEIRPLK